MGVFFVLDRYEGKRHRSVLRLSSCCITLIASSVIVRTLGGTAWKSVEIVRIRTVGNPPALHNSPRLGASLDVQGLAT